LDDAYAEVLKPSDEGDICLEPRFGFMLPDLVLEVLSYNSPNDGSSTVLADGLRSSEKP
jgi:hypothetical protein